jgi:hypothetical protein
MSTVSFDTLKFAQTLRDKAGVPQPQAEGMAEAFAEATGEQIATKADLKELELSLKGDMALLKWMLGFVLAFLVALFFLNMRR